MTQPAQNFTLMLPLSELQPYSTAQVQAKDLNPLLIRSVYTPTNRESLQPKVSAKSRIVNKIKLPAALAHGLQTYAAIQNPTMRLQRLHPKRTMHP